MHYRYGLTSDREKRITFAPASTKDEAIASPIPMEAPVYASHSISAYISDGVLSLHTPEAQPFLGVPSWNLHSVE